jgi:hypothetical protein
MNDEAASDAAADVTAVEHPPAIDDELADEHPEPDSRITPEAPPS